MRSEEYVRPPLVAHEPTSPRLVALRVRVIAVALAIVGLLVLVWLLLTVSGVTNGEDPGLGGLGQPVSGQPVGGQPISGTTSVARVP